MTISRLTLVAALAFVLAACASPPPEQPRALPPTGPASSPTPSATASGPTTVAAAVADYRFASTTDASIDGVGFRAAGTEISCAIYDPYLPESVEAPYAGCVPLTPNYEFPVVMQIDGEDVHGTAVSVDRSGNGVERWISDATFVLTPSPSGDPNAPSRVLENGSSITWSTITCTVLNDTATCENSVSGHGFQISNQSYRVY